MSLIPSHYHTPNSFNIHNLPVQQEQMNNPHYRDRIGYHPAAYQHQQQNPYFNHQFMRRRIFNGKNNPQNLSIQHRQDSNSNEVQQFDDDGNANDGGTEVDLFDLSTRTISSTFLALLGMSGFVVPLLTLAGIPLALMNPNLILAKSLAVLSIPVAIYSYGRALEKQRNVLKNLSSNSSTNASPDASRSAPTFNIIDFSQLFNESSALKVLASGFIHPNVPTSINPLPSSPFTRVRNGTFQESSTKRPEMNSQNDTNPEREQCRERIACEGWARTLPQLLIRTVIRSPGHGEQGKNFDNPDMFQNFVSDFFGNFETFLGNLIPSEEDGDDLDFLGTSRKKNLAQYALTRLKNKEYSYKRPTYNGGGGGGKIKNNDTNKDKASKPNNTGSGSGSLNPNVNNLTINNNEENNDNDCSRFKCSWW